MRFPPFVRRLTDPILEQLRVMIPAGVNRGRWWSLASAGSGYGTGQRASTQMKFFADLLRPGDVVWDVGAHHGFVTLCAAERVGPTGQVHAFEPSARNREMLRRHVAWNKLGNVTIHPFALSDHDGESCFGGAGTSKTQALGAGTEIVEVRCAATLVRQGVLPAPDVVKIDVEGAEADVVEGAMPILPRGARLLIAMHARDADARCAALLAEAGFAMVASPALSLCRTGEWSSDPDLFCAGPECSGRAEDMTLFERLDRDAVPNAQLQ